MIFNRNIKNESGSATIIEATIVFPIVIFILIIFIFLGNAYYQMSRVESAVARTATYVSGLYSDPLLRQMGDSGKAPSSFNNVEPYRYIFTNDEAQTMAQSFLNKELKLDNGLFKKMKPKISNVTCDVTNYFIYQKVTVTAEYQIKIPVDFFGEDVTIIRGTTSTMTSATDGAEFIRNMKMAEDFVETTKLQEKIDDLKENVSKWFKKE